MLPVPRITAFIVRYLFKPIKSYPFGEKPLASAYPYVGGLAPIDFSWYIKYQLMVYFKPKALYIGIY